ncbi:CoA transferase [Hydrogenophaga sp. 2FB]|uniref:CaiB/BaiF CoA transferase family protein n=1 Tax=Hydrogenophaga sp. 2FB TaxID=2502187 RepID=UPI0010F947EF|nr:CoA transferase [Hydrogenophaga sp. 2FB]
MHASSTHLPLQGIRVIDLSTVLFGPYASRWLADHGADVIKVEAPEGDTTRHGGVSREPGMAGSFLTLNRNKRSVVLDLKQPAARDALLKLLEGADVFMHNIRPHKMRAMGLDPETLCERFPRLVYASLTGFSEDGPYSGLPAYDDIIQGMCGLADLMQRQTGEAQYLPTVAADKVCGLIGAQAILTAVLARERTGQGQHVEVPMFECMVDFTLLEHRVGHAFVPPEGEVGYSRVLARWRRPYRTLDGHLCVMPYSTAQWHRFFNELGHPELVSDPRFTDMAARTRNIEALLTLVAEVIARRTSQEWLDILRRLDIPVGPVITLEGLSDDPHLRAVGLFQHVEDADGKGAASLSSSGVRFNGAAPRIRTARRLGEDTRHVLAEAGFEPSQIDALLRSGAAKETTH